MVPGWGNDPKDSVWVAIFKDVTTFFLPEYHQFFDYKFTPKITAISCLRITLRANLNKLISDS
jgi:hypothetical protein